MLGSLVGDCLVFISKQMSLTAVDGQKVSSQLRFLYSLRKLDPDEIQRVMRWHSSTIRFRKRQGTLATLARSLNISVHELQRAMKGHVEGLSLSAQQRECIRRWEARRRRFRRAHPTAATLARSLGISRSTLFLCIQKRGIYRTVNKSDEIGEGGSPQSRQKAGQRAVTSALLRTWRRVRMDVTGS